MNQEFFEKQFASLRDNMDARFDRLENRMEGLEKRMEGLENRMDGQDKRMDALEKTVHKMGLDIEAIKTDVRLIAEGHVMLAEKFSRFEAEYIKHAVESRQDILNLYKITYGQLERRVKELETARQ